MYKLLLCWRYLCTRYLALACIISVMLGVATLIVVNSVMSGFSTKLKERLHGLLSDVLIEAITYDGFPDPKGKEKRILESSIGDKIEAMTPTVDIFAMLQYRYPGGSVTRPVRLIGIEPEGRALIGGFKEHLWTLSNDKLVRMPPSLVPDEEAQRRYNIRHFSFPNLEPSVRQVLPPVDVIGLEEPAEPTPPPPDPPESQPKTPRGIIIGNAIASYRDPEQKPGQEPHDIYVLKPGDDVFITTVSGQKLEPVYDRFAVCGYFKSEMSEYDSNYVFVPLDYLQRLRTMEDRVTSIQIKLKDYADAPAVMKVLKELFPASSYKVETWEEKQGPMLAAIDIERGILNVLLFLIICVAGFGILAIFAMIVVEKTRDIGILKALGASNGGVMSIFLGYGLLLGVVGAGLGTVLGIAITHWINEIEVFLSRVTGQQVFDRHVYYFDKIPTNMQPSSLVLINLGAIAIAVIFSVLPALRAALLHPVRALRYE